MQNLSLCMVSPPLSVDKRGSLTSALLMGAIRLPETSQWNDGKLSWRRGRDVGRAGPVFPLLREQHWTVLPAHAHCPGHAQGGRRPTAPFSELQEFVAQCFSSFLLVSPSFGPWYEKEWDSVVVGTRLRCFPSDGHCVEWTECPKQH